MKKIFLIKGMRFHSCERLIEESLKHIEGIEYISASYVDEKVKTNFNEDKISEHEIKEIIKEGFKWFGIISFSIGAVITGLILTYTIPTVF